MTGESMELEDQGGHEGKLKLSTVEKFVLGGAFTLLCSLLGIVWQTYSTGQEKQTEATDALKSSIGEIKTQQAVTNAQLQALTQQLSNIPQLTSDVATLKVQVDRNSSDIHELQQVRKLR